MQNVLSDNRLGVKIWRNETGHLPILDLSYGSIIVSEDYSEFSLMLPTSNVYGQGAGPLSFAENGTESSNFNK